MHLDEGGTDVDACLTVFHSIQTVPSSVDKESAFVTSLLPFPTKMSDDIDVKPQVGPIPRTQPLPNVSWGKNFFKVELLVGENGTGSSSNDHQLMLPFQQTHVKDAPLSLDYYVATPGLSFSIRCRLARPSREGALYGARVYIDSGLAGKDNVYRHWSNHWHSEWAGGGDDDEVDRSTADHYFWMNPGQQEHIIEGFYRSYNESNKFVFAEPSRKRTVDGDPAIDFFSELDTVGVIRIMFCQVDSFQESFNSRHNKVFRPSQVVVDRNIDKKIQMSVKPGRVVNDGGQIAEQEAVLSKEIVYERRLIYNTFGGFSARQVTAQYSSRSVFYRGMPLKALLTENVRFQGIMAFFREVSSERMNLSTEQRLIDISTSSEQAGHCDTQSEDQRTVAETTQASTNDFVRVEDLVHHISKSLSPAGSYILCTGKNHRGGKRNAVLDYGEKYVQRQGAELDLKLQDFAHKERGLVAFFMNQPGVYDLELDGIEPTSKAQE